MWPQREPLLSGGGAQADDDDDGDDNMLALKLRHESGAGRLPASPASMQFLGFPTLGPFPRGHPADCDCDCQWEFQVAAERTGL